MASDASQPVVINGWTIFAHPFFLEQIEKLIAKVEAVAKKTPGKLDRHPAAKLLKQLRVVAFERIPQDPANPRYRQGATLGDDYKHWCRDKFGSGRFRLFFRYDSSARIIIYAWVNDEHTLRTYGAKNDAYAVFAKMLASGNPPDDWSALVAACKKPSLLQRLSGALKGS